jgi:hypothetical protein
MRKQIFTIIVGGLLAVGSVGVVPAVREEVPAAQTQAGPARQEHQRPIPARLIQERLIQVT